MAYIHKIAAEQPVGVGSIDGRGERPTRRADSVGNCSTGTAQCCNQVITDDSAKHTIAGLAGLNSIVGDIALVSLMLLIVIIGKIELIIFQPRLYQEEPVNQISDTF